MDHDLVNSSHPGVRRHFRINRRNIPFLHGFIEIAFDELNESVMDLLTSSFENRTKSNGLDQEYFS